MLKYRILFKNFGNIIFTNLFMIVVFIIYCFPQLQNLNIAINTKMFPLHSPAIINGIVYQNITLIL